MGHVFASRLLKILNRICKSDALNGKDILLDALREILPGQDDGEKVAVLGDATGWLETDINRSADDVKACAPDVKRTVFDCETALTTLCLRGAAQRAAVARFLVAALRCFNFANHDSATIGEFIALFGRLGIPVQGDVQYCRDMATFGGLDVVDGAVVMTK